MAIARLDLSFVKGDTFARTFTMTDSLDAAVDVTGWTPDIHVRTTAGADTIYSDWGAFFDMTNAATGIVVLTVPAATTAALTAGLYVYDFQMTKSDATVRTYFGGNVLITEDVTT